MNEATLREFRSHLQILRASYRRAKTIVERKEKYKGHGAITEIIKEMYRWMVFQHIRLYHESKCPFSLLEITEENLWCIDMHHVTEGYLCHSRGGHLDGHRQKILRLCARCETLSWWEELGQGLDRGGCQRTRQDHTYPCTLILTEFTTAWSEARM